ncbi:MAG: DUF3990 domain-containing protein [Parasporobacterium sp.]|nr:DUF3990 domain-containing protein [Parasporobacterium sp.]
MIIFHGSNTVVQTPKIVTYGYYKDFGFGFYCTNFERQAQRWALTKNKFHIVNSYLYTPNDNLKHLHFSEMNDSWLDFIASCRLGKEHDYDIVEGPMANDTIWDYVEDFVRGNISREAFWALAKFRYPTHQIVFCTDNALKTISYNGSYTL